MRPLHWMVIASMSLVTVAVTFAAGADEAEDHYLIHLHRRIDDHDLERSSFSTDPSVVPGHILRQYTHGRPTRAGDATNWTRTILYRGQEVRKGTRVTGFRLTIRFNRQLADDEGGLVYEANLAASQVRWPRDGLDFIRLKLDGDLYGEVMATVNDPRYRKMDLKVYAVTEDGAQTSLYADSRWRESHWSIVDLIKDHTQRRHWLGMESTAIRIFRGPAKATLIRNVAYANAKCKALFGTGR